MAPSSAIESVVTAANTLAALTEPAKQTEKKLQHTSDNNPSSRWHASQIILCLFCRATFGPLEKSLLACRD
ncbi:MAG: hypothetical protein ACK6AD_01875 [Cyanobacteriota bacterium]